MTRLIQPQQTMTRYSLVIDSKNPLEFAVNISTEDLEYLIDEMKTKYVDPPTAKQVVNYINAKKIEGVIAVHDFHTRFEQGVKCPVCDCNFGGFGTVQGNNKEGLAVYPSACFSCGAMIMLVNGKAGQSVRRPTEAEEVLLRMNERFMQQYIQLRKQVEQKNSKLN